MAAARQVKVEILGDAKSLASAFGAAEKAASGFGNIVGGVAKVAAGFVVGQGIMKLPGLFSDAVSAGSDLNESLNAVNQIFGDSAQTILDWGKNNATSFGLSQRAFNDLAVPLGAGLKNAGLSMDDVSKHTISLTERAADMASVFNTDVDEALAAIQAGLRGEADPLERFGVGLSAAAVDAEALAMTGKSVASELTNQEKALARVNLIMKQTNDVAGDFTETSDGAANSARIAAAKQEELAAAIGQKLLPVQQALNRAKLVFLQVVADRILPMLTILIDRLKGPLRAAFGLVRDGVLTFVQALQGNWSDNENIHGLHRVIGMVGTVIREQVIPAVTSMAGFFKDTLLPIIRQGVAVVGTIVAALIGGGRSGGLTGALSKIGDLIGEVAPIVLEKLNELATKIGDWIVNTAVPFVAERLGQWADAFGAWAVNAVPPMLERLAELLSALGTWIADTGLPVLFDKLGSWGQALVDWIGPRIGPVLEALGALLLAVGEWIVTVAAPAIGEKLLEWGNQFVAWVEPQIGPMLERLGELAQQIATWIVDTALPVIAQKLVEWGAAFIAWVGPVLADLPGHLEQIATTVITFIQNDAAPRFAVALRSWSDAFVNWTTDVDAGLPAQLQEISTTIAVFIADNGPKFAEQLTSWYLAFIEWTLPVLAEIPEKLRLIDNTIAAFIVEVAEALIPRLAAWVEAFTEWTANVVGHLPSALALILRALSSWVDNNTGNVVSEGSRLGVAMVEGIAAGITSVPGILQSALDRVIDSALDYAKGKLGIESPSQVTHDEIGLPFAQGIASGILAGGRIIDSAVESVIGSGVIAGRTLVDNIGSGGTGGRGTDGGMGSGGTGGRGGGTGSGDVGGRGGDGGGFGGGTGGRGGGRPGDDGIISDNPPVYVQPPSGHFPNPQGGGGTSMGRGFASEAAMAAAMGAGTGGSSAGGASGGSSPGWLALKAGATFLGCGLELIGQDNGLGLFEWPDGRKQWLDSSFCKGGRTGPSDTQTFHAGQQAQRAGTAVMPTPQTSRLVAQTRTPATDPIADIRQAVSDGMVDGWRRIQGGARTNTSLVGGVS